ncbi:MAG: hypothetical protein WA418_03900, partial [Bradyrhizobium sp.]
HAQPKSSHMRPHCRWRLDLSAFQLGSNHVGRPLMFSDVTNRMQFPCIASDIDSQGRIAVVTCRPGSAPASDAIADTSATTLLPDWSCDDDEARTERMTTGCDLKPQKKIFVSPISDASDLRRRSVATDMVSSAQINRRQPHIRANCDTPRAEPQEPDLTRDQCSHRLLLAAGTHGLHRPRAVGSTGVAAYDGS